MKNGIYRLIRLSMLQWLAVLLALASTWAKADENFVAGNYLDANGNQYLVSGPAPSQTGRTQWTVTSTVPKVGTTNVFNAIWETGAATGNTYLAGSSSVSNNPGGYLGGRSYGVTGNTNWPNWNSAGLTISASQVGTTLAINQLSFNGGTIYSTVLTYLSPSTSVTASVTSSTFMPGTYQDSTGNQYLVSGPAPSQTGRSQWTVTSTVPKVGTTNIFNAIWETGTATGNTYLAGSSSVSNNPGGYLGGRSYGVTGNTNWPNWNSAGLKISASQVGTTLAINQLSFNGATIYSTVLTYLSPSTSVTASATSSTFMPGTYQDSTGNQYLVSGTGSQAGRVQWTITSTTAAPGTVNVFNAMWETGAAIGNAFLAGSSSVSNNPGGYLGGRSYGVTGNTNWPNWNSAGLTISASQVGKTLVINQLSFNGGTIYARVFTATDAGQGEAIPRPFNLSTRGQVQTGNNVMIGGFVIGGSTPKKVLIRAAGPSLANYGVTGVLADPMLQLYSGATVIASNDNWQSASNVAEIQATGLAPANALESAILTTLAPGAYTAIVSGSANGTGVGIVEVYEIDNPSAPFINISTRGRVQTGDSVMVGGFIIRGNAPQTVLIRAVGPNLANYGVTGVLNFPKLDLYSGQAVIASNTRWGTSPNQAAIAATGLAPASPLESALLVTLQPGAYTAHVSGADGGSGVGIIEVYAQ